MNLKFTRPVLLVVDDDPAVRESLHLVLDDEYEVLDASDGCTAMSLAASAPIDLVVLDILIPDIDGIQLLSEIDAVRPGIPVVVLSGLDRASIAAAAMRLGAVDYVTKPFEEQMLRSILHAALRRPSAPQLTRPHGGRPTIAYIGGDVRVVAGLAATLARHFNVESLAEPSPGEISARARHPSVFVIDLPDRRPDWLDRAALLLQRCAGISAVTIVNEGGAPEVRFALGERCIVLERPFQLTGLLDVVCTLVSDVLTDPPWQDKRTAAVINAVYGDYVTVSLHGLAAAAGVSPYYLSRWFLEHAGVPLATYVKRVRVQAASYLLQHTDGKLDAVAAAVGFHDASHLSRAFVQLTGRRPRQHRHADV